MVALISTVFLAGLAWLFFFAGRGNFAYLPASPLEVETRPAGTRKTVRFPAVDGEEIEAWFYRPATQRPPLVIMAPGLTGTKQGHLEAFARTFLEQGMAVLMIDFRTFGGSGGLPRHWMDPHRQIEDYEAALAFAQTLAVDQDRIALWGSSFSGGVALSVAARHAGRVAAVIAQVPYLGDSEPQRPGRMEMLKYIALTIAEPVGDTLAKLVGLKLHPVYIPTFGKPGERVFAKSACNPAHRLKDIEALHPFWATMPDPMRGGWENKMLVRALQHFDSHCPLDEIASIPCPVMVIGALKDDMIPIDRIRDGAARLASGHSRFVQFDCGHYDIYMEPHLEPVLRAQSAFLAETLGH
ncbi:MAG TPA: alpha/beta fold hydrolase [Parvibaculum sp.]